MCNRDGAYLGVECLAYGVFSRLPGPDRRVGHPRLRGNNHAGEVFKAQVAESEAQHLPSLLKQHRIALQDTVVFVKAMLECHLLNLFPFQVSDFQEVTIRHLTRIVNNPPKNKELRCFS